MTASRSLRKGDRVLTLNWDGTVLRALTREQPGIEVREVLAIEPLKSTATQKARTMVLFTDRSYIMAMTGSDWLMEN